MNDKTLTFSINPSEVTLLFEKANNGENLAINELVDILYCELKNIASKRRASFQENNTFNTTALVNETWLKLKNSDVKYNNKTHFLSIAAMAMRQILLDAVKSKNRIKRPSFMTLTEANREKFNTVEKEAEWLYQLDLILSKLEKHSSRGATVFNLKFFCGLTLSEISEYLEVSSKTVHRDWEKSKHIITTTFKLLNE